MPFKTWLAAAAVGTLLVAAADVRSDFSLANDLAAGNPAKLAEMQALFLSEAANYGVLPIDDRVFERLDPKLVGRPDLMGGRTSLTLAEGRIPATQPGIFSADETADVGIDLGTPVVEAIGAEAKSRFTGRIPKVTVEVK